jgi:hypothetical protein
MSTSNRRLAVAVAGLALVALVGASRALAQPARIDITETALNKYVGALIQRGVLDFAADLQVCVPGTGICVPDWLCDPEVHIVVSGLIVDVEAEGTEVHGILTLTYCGRVFSAAVNGGADLELSADGVWLLPTVDIDAIQPYLDFPLVGRVFFPPVEVDTAIQPTPIRVGSFVLDVSTVDGRRRFPVVPRDLTLVRLDDRYRLTTDLDFR